MRTTRLLSALLTTLVALIAIAVRGTAHDAHVAYATDVVIASNATLNGDGAGNFATHTATLSACTQYTLRLTYTMAQGGTPVESGIGVEVWNDKGDAYLWPSAPFGERLAAGSPPKYYLRSFRTAANPFVEEIRFKAGQTLTTSPWCSDTTPSYTFRVFNYLAGNTLNYTLSLPGGVEN